MTRPRPVRGGGGHGAPPCSSRIRAVHKCKSRAGKRASVFHGLRVVTERGLEVPRDFAIDGFDGSYICELTTPALTTIRQSIAEMAWNALIQLTQRNAPQNIQMVLPVELEVRASTMLAGR